MGNAPTTYRSPSSHRRSTSAALTRRGRALTIIVGAACIAAVAATQLDARTAAHTDRWLKAATRSHRQFFDIPATGGGIPLLHMLNYYDTWNKAYGVPDKDINAIGTFYGTTTLHGVNDAMWAKYRIGEFLGEKDAAGTAFATNPWRSKPFIAGMEMARASIESLQTRGASFILCDNALQFFAQRLAVARDLEPNEVYKDLRANILPGVELIPGMVVAIEQSHTAGISYYRQ